MMKHGYDALVEVCVESKSWVPEGCGKDDENKSIDT